MKIISVFSKGPKQPHEVLHVTTKSIIKPRIGMRPNSKRVIYCINKRLLNHSSINKINSRMAIQNATKCITLR